MRHILFFSFLLAATTLCAQRNPFTTITERNGKIGIGTEMPDELLTVKGKIHTQEVLVDLQGAVAPDYVFDYFVHGFSAEMPTYRLLPLAELERYVREHRHLPKIPSAQQLREDGLSLKEMNLLLLEKIEELTLYTLQQQKEIDQMKEKLSQLDN